MARWALVCTTRDELRIVVQGASVLAGRLENAQLRLPADDLRASRRHATFELTGDELLVADAGSSTGTYVNDQRVERATLGENDLVRMGTLSFRVERVTEVHKKELRDVLTTRKSHGTPRIVARRCRLCGAGGTSPGRSLRTTWRGSASRAPTRAAAPRAAPSRCRPRSVTGRCCASWSGVACPSSSRRATAPRGCTRP
ncbi:MAG: FHA domain-containing protein [Myxococcales bacterium]|nr:FHA domain-containing protein [Myxococcales bacterium]